VQHDVTIRSILPHISSSTITSSTLQDDAVTGSHTVISSASSGSGITASSTSSGSGITANRMDSQLQSSECSEPEFSEGSDSSLHSRHGVKCSKGALKAASSVTGEDSAALNRDLVKVAQTFIRRHNELDVLGSRSDKGDVVNKPERKKRGQLTKEQRRAVGLSPKSSARGTETTNVTVEQVRPSSRLQDSHSPRSHGCM
jgi:hypothetical protein